MRHNRDGERKCCRLFGLFSLLLLAGSLLLEAETFTHFKRKQVAEFKEYKDANDKAFVHYLKSQWQAYKKFRGVTLYDEPKPKKMPRTQPVTPPKAGPKIYIKLQKIPQPQKPPVVMEVVNQTKESNTSVHDVVFDFFGTKLGFDIPQKIKRAKFYPTSQQGIANYFDAAASSEYETLLDEIKNVKKAMHLNDWGLYLLVDKIGHKLYRYDDEAQLFSWFVFNKLGYDVRVGLANGRVISMYHSKKIIYATPNFRFGMKRYYLLSRYAKESVGAVYSYAKNYTSATKALDLSLDELPLLQPDYKTKKLFFTYLGKKYTLSYRYNKNLIDFFATYPQTDYATFFNAPVDELSYASLIESLRRYINGKRAAEAMNFVLGFVQNAFAYETDMKQFGHEKVMFAEETLFYDASDCEDRSVLYSFLTKKLFGVSVVALKYPNHMATALDVPLEGDKVYIKGREYVIADPTYVNAPIGQAMPQFKGQRPEDFIFINLKN